MKKIIVFTLLLIPIIATSQQVPYVGMYEWSFRMQLESGQVWAYNRVEIKVFLVSKNKQTNQIADVGQGNGRGLFGSSTTPYPPIWTVNGIVNGNDEVGHIFVSEGYPITYSAPWYKLDKNVVEVKAFYKDVNFEGKISDITLTGQIEILGGREIRLDPDSAWLRVNDTIPLTIVEENETVHPYPFPHYYHDTLYGEGWYLNGNTRTAPEWTVNGISNGNNLVGEAIKSGEYHITFKAPIRIPVNNPVKVIAAYDSIYLNSKWTHKKFSALIWIVDSVDKSPEIKDRKTDTIVTRKQMNERFEVKMVCTLIGGSREVWGGVVTYSDEGSFRVSVEGENAVVTDIRNNLEVLTNNCAKIITNPTTCTGMLHVAGIKSTKVTPAHPPGQPYPIVEIWFVPYPTELTRFKFTCPPPPSAQKSSIGKVDLSQMAMLTMSRMPALPPYIKFIAKDGDQIIMEKGSPGSEIYYKFSVRKVKDD